MRRHMAKKLRAMKETNKNKYSNHSIQLLITTAMNLFSIFRLVLGKYTKSI